MRKKKKKQVLKNFRRRMALKVLFLIQVLKSDLVVKATRFEYPGYCSDRNLTWEVGAELDFSR